MTTEPTTAAGRALLSHVKGLGPRLDTVTMTARRLRDGVLAIEAEARQQDSEALRAALKHVGHVGLHIDEDGVIRCFSRTHGGADPVVAALAALPAPPSSEPQP